MTRFALGFAALCLLGGCVSQGFGGDFPMEAAESLQEGSTTCDQAVAALGEPNSRQKTGDVTLLNYSYYASGMNFWGNLSGSSITKTASFGFDRDCVLKFKYTYVAGSPPTGSWIDRTTEGWFDGWFDWF